MSFDTPSDVAVQADVFATLAAPPASPVVVAMSYAVAMRVLERIAELIHPAADAALLDEIVAGALGMERKLALMEAAARDAAVALTSPDKSETGRTAS